VCNVCYLSLVSYCFTTATGLKPNCSLINIQHNLQALKEYAPFCGSSQEVKLLGVGCKRQGCSCKSLVAGQLKSPTISSGREHTAFQLVAWCLNQLRCNALTCIFHSLTICTGSRRMVSFTMRPTVEENLLYETGWVGLDTVTRKISAPPRKRTPIA
jgi:hypothetical protein